MENNENHIYILNKIKHKPLIFKDIFSFASNRPYIFINLINTSQHLKSDLKATFAKLKKNNKLSSEINVNLQKFIYYKKIVEKFPLLVRQIKNKFKKINKDFSLIITSNEPINEELFFEKNMQNIQDLTTSDNDIIIKVIKKYVDENYEKNVNDLLSLYYRNFMRNFCNNKRHRYEEYDYFNYINYYDSSYLSKGHQRDIKEKDFFDNYKKMIERRRDFFNEKIKEEIKLSNDKKIAESIGKIVNLIPISYDKYCLDPIELLKIYLKNLLEKKDIEKFFEIIYLIYNDYFAIFNKKEFDYYKYPIITKMYRNSCRDKISKQINNNINEYNEINQISVIKRILTDLKEYNESNDLLFKKVIINLLFDYLLTEESFLLYNLPNTLLENKDLEIDGFLDIKYFNYIKNKSHYIKQNLAFICIIDRHKYPLNMDNIIYPYVTKFHFKLFSHIDLNELFMFYNLPINEIFKIYESYFIKIKNFKYIKQISFDDEFVINKDQFLSYNDEYYQSIISYIIDQYFIKYNKDKNNILKNLDLEDISIREDKLDNIYERYKILYGFNKMFPKLKKKKIFEIRYNDVLNENFNFPTNKEDKILIIDFEFKIFDNTNIVIDDINDFISNIYTNRNINNNIEILSFINFKMSKDININLNLFTSLSYLKEFFINNNNISIINESKTKLDLSHKANDNFPYVYGGFDTENNLIYYRNGKNKILSNDILDLINFFNNKIVKLEDPKVGNEEEYLLFYQLYKQNNFFENKSTIIIISGGNIISQK